MRKRVLSPFFLLISHEVTKCLVNGRSAVTRADRCIGILTGARELPRAKDVNDQNEGVDVSEMQRLINANESKFLFLFCPPAHCVLLVFIFIIIRFSCNRDAQSTRVERPIIVESRSPLFFHSGARLSHCRTYLLVLCDLNHEPCYMARVRVSANVYPKKQKRD